MSRAKQQSFDLSSQDSFLDIVANIVGILILLVMVVGVRAARTPDNAASEAAKAAVEQLAQDSVVEEVAERTEKIDEEQQLVDALKQIASTQSTAERKVRQALKQKREVLERDKERVELIAFVTQVKEEIESQRQNLDANDRRDFDLRRQLTEAQIKISELTREQVALASQEQAKEVKTLESFPTPLAETANGDEIHLRLSHGRVKVVPTESLIREAGATFRQRTSALQNRDVADFTIGPIDEFRLRYTLAKRTVNSAQGVGTFVQAVMFEFLPVEPEIGELVDDAMEDNSNLAAALNARRAGSTAVVVWAYPDSFKEFGRLKKWLYERGYKTAGRPKREGSVIASSIFGRKSSVQ